MPQPLSPQLRELQQQIEAHARGYGLDFFDIVYEVLDWEEISEVAAYGGYPMRYPHWRFGMDYLELSRSYAYGLSTIYEMVINNDPTYAYLLAANHWIDQKLVMAHVCGHGDFFKHNFSFAHTNRKMVDEMANHATRVRRAMERHGVDAVEGFLDRCLSLENLIDYNAPHIRRRPVEAPAAADDEAEDGAAEPKRLRAKPYMDAYINPGGALDAERRRLAEARQAREERFPSHPQRDVLLFLLEHAPLKNWERDLLGIVREEAYYFAPQGRTKIMNEGWACIGADTLVYTELGLIPMAEVVDRCVGRSVSDGRTPRRVYDRNVIRDHPTVRVRTRRGLVLEGSTNHRVLLGDGTEWKRLDALSVGESVVIGGGAALWPREEVRLAWTPQQPATLQDVAGVAGVSLSTVMRHRAGWRVMQRHAVLTALGEYTEGAATALMARKRKKPDLPAVVDTRLGAVLGYLIGDGHISRVKRHVGLTTGDLQQAEAFERLCGSLFGVVPRRKRDGSRWRVLLHSETLSDFLQQALGLESGPCARRKRVPDAVLRSPEPVVRAFLRAYFDCDAHAGRQGVILSTASETMSEQVQLLLLNYGILSRRRVNRDGCWHVHVAGRSAARFAERVGFGLDRKQAALERHVAAHHWFREEQWDDEVVEVTRGRADVYDISVEETHRYAAAGFINHNSYWHARILTEKALEPSEVVDFADRHAGTMAWAPGRLNPYKLGLELWRDIEERWNTGRHGRAWEECNDGVERRRWDTGAMAGRDRIFEVRRHYNDVTFIDEFLTPDFVRTHGLFAYEYDPHTRQYYISDRDFHAVKQKLLFMLTNLGQPLVELSDANHANRGELVLTHRYEGVPLKLDQARETIENVQRLWRRPVHLETYVNDRPAVLHYDGTHHSQDTTGAA